MSVDGLGPRLALNRCTSNTKRLPNNRRLINVYGTDYKTRYQLRSGATQQIQLRPSNSPPHSSKTSTPLSQENEDFKLEYKQTGKKLQGSVDSDWADEKNRKSVGGCVVCLGGAAVYRA